MNERESERITPSADADSETELIEKVSLIKHGNMQPLGGPVVFTASDGKQVILQAMVSFPNERR